MRKEWILLLLLALTGLIYHKKTADKHLPTQAAPWVQPPIINPPAPVDPKIPAPPQPPTIVVEIINWPAVRQVSSDGIGQVLADIESHMPAGHQYKFANNKITWAHETTHGINANIRNKNYNPNRKINAFYVLQNRGIIVDEPKTTIASVAGNIPQSWRGTCYNLYLVQQRKDWNNEPLYLCDEWVAYTNGAACRQDLKMEDQASEMEFTCEFTGYVLSLAYTVKRDCPDYDDKQFKAFVMWNIERTMKIYNNESGANTRLEAIRTSSDGETIRQFARSYFGADWCKEILGF